MPGDSFTFVGIKNSVFSPTFEIFASDMKIPINLKCFSSVLLTSVCCSSWFVFYGFMLSFQHRYRFKRNFDVGGNIRLRHKVVLKIVSK